MFASKIYSSLRRPWAKAILTSCALAASLASASAAMAGDPIPTAAAAAGYRMETLAVDTFNTTTVDQKLTYKPGFKMYYFNFDGMPPAPGLSTYNSDGSITLATNQNGWNGYGSFLVSAGKLISAPYFRGIAFGGGGYYEATLSFNAALVNTNNGSWPAWWAMSLEHMDGDHGDQWAGQRPGYMHYVEPDFFEYDAGASVAGWGGNVHDWYGVNNAGNYMLPWNVVFRPVPANTNFSQYHRYGFLWIPATAMKKGSFSYYFDGVQIGATTYYTKFNNQPPVPGANQPWTFGIIDQQHLVLIIGSGPPVPMKVKTIQVWQASAAGNLHN
jgi:hypothetical protein